MKISMIYKIGAIILGIGIILYLIGSIMVGFNYKKLSTTKYKKNNLTYQNIENININERINSVKVKESKDKNIHITYYNNKHEIYKINNDENTLNIKSKYKNITKDNILSDLTFNFNTTNTTLIIQLPNNYNGNLNIKSNGYLNIKNISFNNLTINTKYDDIILKNIKSNNINILNKDASCNLTNITNKNNIKINTTNGELIFKNINTTNMESTTIFGYINLKTGNFNNLSLITKDEDINVNDININKSLTLNTTNGDIIGSVNDYLKNYNINTKTTNGESNLPEHLNVGPKKLNIQTTNSDISIKFKKEK